MLPKRIKLQSVLGRLLLIASLLFGMFGLNPRPTTQASANLAADAPPAPATAPVPAMLPPQTPQRNPAAPPPPPSLDVNSASQSTPIVDHIAARFEQPVSAANKSLIVQPSASGKAALTVNSAAITADPNLLSYQPPGWDGVVVLSTQTGTNASETLYEGSDAYLDWSIVNDGGETPTTFTTCVYIDNVATVDTCWTTAGLQQGFFTAIEDWLVNPPPTAGWHLIGVWSDVYDEVFESNEDDNYSAFWFYWYPSNNSLNLTPYVPTGWADPVVPASETGANGNLRLYTDDPTYFDTSFANYGTQSASEFTSCLYVDEVEQYCDRIALNANIYAFYEDHLVTIAASGWHSVTLRVDVLDEVLEANEDDNVWEARFYWEASSKPDLHAYQPDGWDDALVVSTQTGAHITDLLLADQPAYIDWAFVNDGWNDVVGSFTVELYVDGTLNQSWTIDSGLLTGYYLYAEDHAITLPAGTHLLEIRADAANTISESNENNNTHQAEYFWNQTSGVPGIDIQPPTSLSINVTVQTVAASAAAQPERTSSSLRTADVRMRGMGAMRTPPTQGIYPPVPLAAQSPSSITNADLSAGLPPVGNQGAAGSCVGWSSSYYYKSFQERVDQGWTLTELSHQFAPNFVWNQGQGSDVGACGGMLPSRALEVMSTQGSVPLSVLPYTYDCRQAVTPAQKDAAASYRAQNYGPFFQYGTKPTDEIIDQMRAWLSGGDPILTWIEATPEFQNPAGAQCVVDLPNQGPSAGGHAITIVGFSDDNFYAPGGAFKIVNSWGTGYGCSGFSWLSYRWFKEQAVEAWWMRDIRTGGNASRDFTITNSGTRSLTVSSIAKHSTPETWLELVPPVAISPEHPLVIEPGQKATIEINVRALGLPNDTYTGLIDITSDDPNNPVKTLRVFLTVGVPLAAAPPPAVSVVPTDGASGLAPNSVTVEWQPIVPALAAGANNIVYDVRLDTINPPAEINCNDVDVTTCTVANLKPNTTYFWRVVAADGMNVSLGPVRSFTTGDSVAEPTPTETTTPTPTVEPATPTATATPKATLTPTATPKPNSDVYLPIVSR